MRTRNQMMGRKGFGIVLGASIGLAFSASSCSFLIDTDGDQCKADNECASFPGRTCQGGVCVAGSATGECKVNADCAPKGPHFICRKDNLKCVGLTTPACTTIHGDDKNDDAVIIGAILPTTGPDVSAGKPLEESIVLAIDEFKKATNGLPPLAGGSGGPRPLVLVGCSDNSEDPTAIAAANHLVDDVGVAAIIGGAFSGTTTNIATTVTIKKNVLLFSPSATSATITNLDDHDLVWRTAPSDTFQAQALRYYVPTVEKAIKDADATITEVKVAILNKGDTYGSGLAKALEADLQINGKKATDQPNAYKRLDYGNPDDTMTDPLKYGPTVSTVLAFKPHIILIFGGNEGITDIFSKIEEQWAASQPTVTYNTRFIFSDGGLVEPLWTYSKMTDELRKRITGTVPGVGGTDPLFSAFRSSFLSKFPSESPDVFGAAGAYDITYLLAYATVGLGAQPLTGPNLAKQLMKVSSGPEVTAGGDISDAFNKAAAGGINFSGASGPLDFDPKTGEASSDIQIWCLPSDGMGKAASGTNSGQYYDAKAKGLAGMAGAACN